MAEEFDEREDIHAEFLPTESEWLELAKDLAANTARYATATDTETTGCDPEEETPVYYARPIVWSVGVADGPLMPRGYRKARGYVLPWQAALFEPLQRWLRSEYGRVWTFNGRYDRHAFKNIGVDTVLDDALEYLRVLDPGQDSYSLKECMPRYLGYPSMGRFSKVFSEPVYVTHKRKHVTCSWDDQHHVGNTARKKCERCGALNVVTYVEETKELRPRKVHLQEVFGMTYDLKITPFEHKYWMRGLRYSALDAIANAEIGSILPDMSGCKLPAKVPYVTLR